MIDEKLRSKVLSYEGNFYSQLKQDILVLTYTDFKKNGYFVEVGSNDGVFLSNTLLLEKSYSWQGILCEPVKSLQEKLRENRSCLIDSRAVYSKSGLEVEFKELPNNKDLSGIIHTFSNDNHTKKRNQLSNKNYFVETISLNDLLDHYNAPTTIDYISIDTEGSEFDILSTFDFNKYKVALFTIEHNYIDDKRNKIYELLISNGYKRILTDLSEWDDWYILKD